MIDRRVYVGAFGPAVARVRLSAPPAAPSRSASRPAARAQEVAGRDPPTAIRNDATTGEEPIVGVRPGVGLAVLLGDDLVAGLLDGSARAGSAGGVRRLGG